jgi:hypothetical protein
MEVQVTYERAHRNVASTIVDVIQAWSMCFHRSHLKEANVLVDDLNSHQEISNNFDIQLESAPPKATLSRRMTFLVFNKNIRHDHKDLYAVFYPKTKLGCELEAISLSDVKVNLGNTVTINVDGRIYDKCSD